MHELYPRIEQVQPESIENWKVSYKDLPYISELGIRLDTYGGYVNEAFYSEMPKKGVETMGSDGFTHCSGLIVFEPGRQKVIVAHFTPYEGGFSFPDKHNLASSLLDTFDPNTPRDMVLIQGELSDKQELIEDAASSANFGIRSLRRVVVDSGKDRPWGFVFYKSTGKLKTFARTDPGTISTFSLFPELNRANI